MNETPEINKGYLLISHKGHYHYAVEYVRNNKVGLFWVHRKSGETSRLYRYRREINMDRAAVDYDVVPPENVNWNDYSNIDEYGL
ncbi:MAG: hypothetical protein GX640_21095 [Fibrobacter sp.]|nr:hypothetical protein [Fibrobacter sp.]